MWAGASVRLPVTGFVEASDVAELEALSRVEEVTEEQVAALVDA